MGFDLGMLMPHLFTLITCISSGKKHARETVLLFLHRLKHDIIFLPLSLCNGPLFLSLNAPILIPSLCMYPVCVSSFCLFSHKKQTEVSGGSMKRSVSTVADQRANGLWQEEKSPERVYRPRHKSYKAAGQSRCQISKYVPTVCSFFFSLPALQTWITGFKKAL